MPPQVDWVGFDYYCRPFSDIEAKLAILERRTTPRQRLWLVPEAVPMTPEECGTTIGQRTDAQIAALQYQYFALAERHPRVIGLMPFGFWTSGYDSGDLPRTVAAHRAIAARVIRPPAPPAPPPPPPPPPAAPAPVAKQALVTKRKARINRRGRVRIRVACPADATVPCTGRMKLWPSCAGSGASWRPRSSAWRPARPSA